jgi:hypothetical protein
MLHQMDEPAPVATVTAPTRPARPRARRSWPFVAAAVALSAYWPWLWSRAFGSITALAVIGKQGGPATDTFVHDFPHGFRFAGLGHDGRYFYTIARHPFDYTLLRQRIPITSYRYRRILYPFLAGRLAPHGGTALLLAFVFVSLVGVGIGAWAMTRFPRAPRWLPLIVAADPGVAVALCFTLGDALATGLALAAFAVMFRRRWAVATVLVVLACLTRETSLLAALCLATWPGIPRRARVTLAVVPCATYAAWALLVAHLTRSSVFAAPEGGLFTFPLRGWAHGTHARLDLLIPLALVAVLVAALASRRRAPLPVRLYIGATTVMLICSTRAITDQWIDSSRVVAVALPLAVWVLAQRSRSRTGAEVRTPVEPASNVAPAAPTPA